MNPYARSYVPRPQSPLEKASQFSPAIGTLTGWPSFPSHTLPAREVIRMPPDEASTKAQPKAAVIEFISTYPEELNALVHSPEDLSSNGYVLHDLTDEAIAAKKRCDACGKFCNRAKRFANKTNRGQDTKSKPSADSNAEALAALSIAPLPNGHPDAGPPPPKNICHFHPGVVNRKNRTWTCCNKPLSEKPCAGAPEHSPVVYAPGQLEEQWQYFSTPAQEGRGSDPRFAVAIDCEMGTALDGDTELIRITLLDYFSGEILIDKLVYPDVVMQHFNTRFSGVTRLMMETAKRSKTCLFGKTQARQAVWKYVGPQTIVIGHSADNDLKALRWIHNRVVDSFMLEPKPVEEKPEEKDKDKAAGKDQAKGKDSTAKDASSTGKTPLKNGKEADPGPDKLKPPKTPKGSGPRALKTLARVKLGREIQNHGKQGHDSLEDAIAARDLVHWQVLERRKQPAGKAAAQ